MLALLARHVPRRAGTAAHVVPGEGATLDVWILGSSGGVSASVAGERGLPFAANYHVAPSAVLEAIAAYRAAFRPSAGAAEPYVAVSADVVVAPTDAEARELATGYALWVRSIRTAEGAIPFPTPAEARRHVWTDDDRASSRTASTPSSSASPETVADQLEILAAATGADELLLTTITHDHADRVRSYELIAAEWSDPPTACRSPSDRAGTEADRGCRREQRHRRRTGSCPPPATAARSSRSVPTGTAGRRASSTSPRSLAPPRTSASRAC